MPWGLCLPLIRPIGSRRSAEVFVMEPTHAGHLHHPALARRLHTPWLGGLQCSRHRLPSGPFSRRFFRCSLCYGPRGCSPSWTDPTWRDIALRLPRTFYPSFPAEGHPPRESDIATRRPGADTVTGLSPVGALPLQAARFGEGHRRHRRLERGRYVEPAKLVPERDDVSDDGDQRWPEVEGRLWVGEVAERASHRFLSLRCAPAEAQEKIGRAHV